MITVLYRTAYVAEIRAAIGTTVTVPLRTGGISFPRRTILHLFPTWTHILSNETTAKIRAQHFKPKESQSSVPLASSDQRRSRQQSRPCLSNEVPTGPFAEYVNSINSSSRSTPGELTAGPSIQQSNWSCGVHHQRSFVCEFRVHTSAQSFVVRLPRQPTNGGTSRSKIIPFV